jgi:membrane fusion protein, multidrug efflux system
LRVITSGLEINQKVIIEGLSNPMVRPGAVVTPTSGEIKTADAKN